MIIFSAMHCSQIIIIILGYFKCQNSIGLNCDWIILDRFYRIGNVGWEVDLLQYLCPD